MELFLFRHSEWQKLYNCSGAVEQLDVLYPLGERTFPILAWTTIVLSAVYTTLYVPCMFSIWKYLDNACYKFLFCIGLADFVELALIGFFHGFLSLKGAFFCTYPEVNYIAGALVLFAWVCETTIDLILAINRCIDMICPALAEVLFKANRAWLWVFGTSAYAFYCFSFTPPAAFVPMYFSWFFNPFTGLRQDPNGAFVNYNNNVQDLVTAIASPTLYVCFLVALAVKIRENRRLIASSSAASAVNSSMDSVQKMIFLQVASISILNTATGFLYCYMENFSAPKPLIIVGFFCWLHIHGLPPVIYLALNKTIRADCVDYLRRLFPVLFNHNGHSLTQVVDLRTQNE